MFPAEEPVIVNVTEQLVVREFSPTVLNCSARGLPPPTITWFFTNNNGPIITLTSITAPGPMLGYTTSRLIIGAATESSTGVYTCVAENRAGRVNASVELTVQCK